MKPIQLPSEFITSVRSAEYPNGQIKLVICTKRRCNSAQLSIGGVELTERFNDVEPFDPYTHVFWLSREQTASEQSFCMTVKNIEKNSPYFASVGEYGTVEGVYSPACEEKLDEVIAAADNDIKIQTVTETQIIDGVVSRIYDCTDKNGDPVKMFALFADAKKATMIAGTADNGYAPCEKIQTVMEQAEAAIRDGEAVIAATNADFFDMFGDCSPSGLTMKDGKIVSNINKSRAFFGVTKDGTHVITSVLEEPDILSRLEHAVAGRDILVRDGECFDVGSLEAFGDRRHPRTCVGLYPNNDFVILVVDGRIPGYSHGASLCDLMHIMKGFGVSKAINLDGGGSSTMIVKQDGALTMLNHPADLHKPLDKLIRPVFNSVLVVERH